jgi:uncharacterized protein YdbL (DUF1318 family)
MTFSQHRPKAAMPCFDRTRAVLAAVFLLTALFLSVGGASLPAAAQSLDQAKAAGQIGEQPDGYLGVVDPGASAAIRQMISDINLRRRERYRDIAGRNNTNLQAVEALTGKKLVEDAPKGQFVRLPDGRWVRK